MGFKRIVGIVLIAAGVLGLLYGGFSFTKETHKARLGPLELSVDEKERVNVPVWLSVGSVVAGVVLLAFGRK
jgi:multidrug transporter EmrE-like cation transporter